MPTRTQVNVRRSGDTTRVVRTSGHWFGHQFPPDSLWSQCRCLRRGHKQRQGLRQTSPGLFRRGHARSSEGTLSIPFLPTYRSQKAPKFYQEAIMWKHGKHPNVVPFRGVTTVPLQLVSDWMSGGNIMEYLKEHPGADRLSLVRSPRFA